MNDYFDKIYLINLLKRRDRLNNSKKELDAMNINYTLHKAVDADIKNVEYKHQNIEGWNKYSAALVTTTIEIIKDAIKNNYTKIFIFEDDVIFTKNAKTELNNIKWLDDAEWDMLHFGTIDRSTPIFYNNNWDIIKLSYCCHAYGIHSRIYKDYLYYLNLMDKPIDHITVSNFQPFRRCFKMKPTICYQKPDYSNIRKTQVNYLIQ